MKDFRMQFLLGTILALIFTSALSAEEETPKKEKEAFYSKDSMYFALKTAPAPFGGALSKGAGVEFGWFPWRRVGFNVRVLHQSNRPDYPDTYLSPIQTTATINPGGYGNLIYKRQVFGINYFEGNIQFYPWEFPFFISLGFGATTPVRADGKLEDISFFSNLKDPTGAYTFHQKTSPVFYTKLSLGYVQTIFERFFAAVEISDLFFMKQSNSFSETPLNTGAALSNPVQYTIEKKMLEWRVGTIRPYNYHLQFSVGLRL